MNNKPYRFAIAIIAGTTALVLAYRGLSSPSHHEAAAPQASAHP
jgi:hypothetical protein